MRLRGQAPPETMVGKVSDDRQVHARGISGLEVVRYDRAGKWFLELPGDSRKHVGVRDAARWAWRMRATGGEVFVGLPGGGAFDRLLEES